MVSGNFIRILSRQVRKNPTQIYLPEIAAYPFTVRFVQTVFLLILLTPILLFFFDISTVGIRWFGYMSNALVVGIPALFLINYFYSAVRYSISRMQSISTKGFDHQPKVAIFIPVTSELRNLKLSINAILKQHYSNFEIIIISNLSLDRHNDLKKFVGIKKGKECFIKVSLVHLPGTVSSELIKTACKNTDAEIICIFEPGIILEYLTLAIGISCLYEKTSDGVIGRLKIDEPEGLFNKLQFVDLQNEQFYKMNVHNSVSPKCFVEKAPLFIRRLKLIEAVQNTTSTNDLAIFKKYILQNYIVKFAVNSTAKMSALTSSCVRLREIIEIKFLGFISIKSKTGVSSADKIDFRARGIVYPFIYVLTALIFLIASMMSVNYINIVLIWVFLSSIKLIIFLFTVVSERQGANIILYEFTFGLFYELFSHSTIVFLSFSNYHVNIINRKFSFQSV